MLELRNPHSVLATLAVRPAAVRTVRVNQLKSGTAWDDVVTACEIVGVRFTVGPEKKSQQRRPQKGRRDQRGTERSGAGSATIEPPSPVPLANVLKNRGDGHGIWLALDQVQDPQNLGAIFRLAGFFDVRGILMTRDKSAPVNETVCDIATGGTEYVPYSIVPNLAAAMKQAGKADLWTLGTCERSQQSIYSTDRQRDWLLVVGNEGTGLRRLTRENCDTLVSLPAFGQIPSLNVATATAACLTALKTPDSN